VQLDGDVSNGNSAELTPTPETQPTPATEAQPTPASPSIPAQRDPALPPNFNSVSDLQAAYTEAQRKITELSQTKPAPTDGKPAPQAPTGLELDRYTAEFNSMGRLSENSFSELASKGIPRHIAEAYIDGQVARASSVVSRGHELVGGAERYQQMIGWAASSLSPSEVHAFNSQVNNTDAAVREFAVKSLASRWQAEAGGQPSFVKGSGVSGGGGGHAFGSEAEMTRAIQDPKYKEDAGYRAQVQRRIAQTNF